jgi:hypothetical protein
MGQPLIYPSSSLHAPLSRRNIITLEECQSLFLNLLDVKKFDKSGYASPSLDVYNIEDMGCAQLKHDASFHDHTPPIFKGVSLIVLPIWTSD